MYPQIKIERKQSLSETKREVFAFIMKQYPAWVLQYYNIETRKSKREPWQIEKCWNIFLRQRDDSLSQLPAPTEIPFDVTEQLRLRINDDFFIKHLPHISID